jgi:hypothetical protein
MLLLKFSINLKCDQVYSVAVLKYNWELSGNFNGKLKYLK